MKSQNDFTQENVTKSMLEIILEKESFDDILKYIVTLSRIEDEDINIKVKFPYSTFDKLAMIKKYTGSINLLQCLMDVYAKYRKTSENSDKKKKPSKFLKLKRVRDKGKEKEVDDEEEDESEKDNFGYTFYTNSSNPVKIDGNKKDVSFNFGLPPINKERAQNVETLKSNKSKIDAKGKSEEINEAVHLKQKIETENTDDNAQTKKYNEALNKAKSEYRDLLKYFDVDSIVICILINEYNLSINDIAKLIKKDEDYVKNTYENILIQYKKTISKLLDDSISSLSNGISVNISHLLNFKPKN